MDGTTISVMASIAGVIFLLFKFSANQAEGRIKEKHESFETQISVLFKKFEKNATAIQSTREEVHKNYVHVDALEVMNKRLDGNIGHLSTQLEELKKSTNQIIGMMKSYEPGNKS